MSPDTSGVSWVTAQPQERAVHRQQRAAAPAPARRRAAAMRRKRPSSTTSVTPAALGLEQIGGRLGDLPDQACQIGSGEQGGRQMTEALELPVRWAAASRRAPELSAACSRRVAVPPPEQPAPRARSSSGRAASAEPGLPARRRHRRAIRRSDARARQLPGRRERPADSAGVLRKQLVEHGLAGGEHAAQIGAAEAAAGAAAGFPDEVAPESSPAPGPGEGGSANGWRRQMHIGDDARRACGAVGVRGPDVELAHQRARPGGSGRGGCWRRRPRAGECARDRA